MDNKKNYLHNDIKDVIFLTACVSPKGMSKTALQSSEERKRQYEKAITWYLKNTDIPIVVIDNSMFDLSQNYTEYVQSGRIEFLFFDGNSYNKSLGKGYGEAKIIKYGLANSVLLRTSRRIIKITGRLIVKNINRLIKCSTSEIVLYANINNDGTRLFCDSRFFIAGNDIIRKCFESDEITINDGNHYYFEHYLYDKCRMITKEFYLPVIYSGSSGSSGDIYRTSFWSYIKPFIHYMLHKFRLFYVK